MTADKKLKFCHYSVSWLEVSKSTMISSRSSVAQATRQEETFMLIKFGRNSMPDWVSEHD